MPTTNPLAVVRQRVAATEIEITYHRPAVKGRQIFEGLVSYGKIWRTGADQATRIAFSTPVTLKGTAIEAGSYELFSVPGEAELMALAVENAPTHIGMLYRQALILERKGDLAGARAAAERSLAGAAEQGPELREEYRRLNTALE